MENFLRFAMGKITHKMNKKVILKALLDDITFKELHKLRMRACGWQQCAVGEMRPQLQKKGVKFDLHDGDYEPVVKDSKNKRLARKVLNLGSKFNDHVRDARSAWTSPRSSGSVYDHEKLSEESYGVQGEIRSKLADALRVYCQVEQLATKGK